MSRFRLLLVAALVATSPALAGDEGGSSGVSFDPRLENREEGAHFSVTGSVKGFPEATAVHVTLLVEGRSKAPIRASFIKATLDKEGRFGADFDWPSQQLAPMLYKAQVVLYVDEQRPDVRRQVIQEYGWPTGHCEVLGSKDMQFGTDEELGKFSRQSIVELRDLVAGFEALRAELQQLAASPADAKLDEYTERLAEHEKKFVAYTNAYVVRVEGELVQRMQSVIATLSRCVRQHKKGQNPTNRLIQAADEIKIVVSEIDSRLPLDMGGSGDEPEKDKDKEKEKDGQ